MADSADPVLKSVADGIATLTLNRPERNNGWNDALGRKYFELLDECEADPEVRVIIVTGSGKSFCPGADMNDLQSFTAGKRSTPPAQGADPAGDDEPLVAPMKRPTELASRIGKPVIAAINGACAGMGLSHALYADVRFASRTAKFSFAYSRRGLIAEWGAAWTLPRLIGTSRALELLMSSRIFTAEEAERLGVVNFVTEPESLLDEARAYAKDLADNCCPTAMAIMKRQVYGDYFESLRDAVTESIDLMNWTLRRPDFKEGVNSWLEKRPPAFAPYTGRTGDPYEPEKS